MQGLEKLQIDDEINDASQKSTANNQKNIAHTMSKTKIERPVLVPSLFAGSTSRRKRSTRKIKSWNGSNSTITTATTTTPATTLTAASNSSQNHITQILLPDGLEPFEHQVAGHMYNACGKKVGMLKHKDDFVLKPITKPLCGEREKQFYEVLQTTQDPIIQELKVLVPGYHGTKNIPVNGQDVTCLVLDNLTKGLKEPCIMDIKIGRRTWDPLATKEKMQVESKKYVHSKQEVAFCIPGFQVRNIMDGKLCKYGKEYGMQLNGETVKDALKMFLNAESGLCRPLLVQFLGSLWRILNWCRKQTKLHIYSSSLLLIYDARLLRHYLKTKNVFLPKTCEQINNRFKRNRPPSLAISDGSNATSATSPGFSGQLTSEGPKFERSLSTNSAHLATSNTPVNTNNNNCPWKKSLRKLQRTHSFSNNYEEDLKHLKQNYIYMLDDLVDDSSNVWANVKMIDFAHVYPAEKNSLDSNYLEGIENLVKIFEGFLQEIS